MAAAVSPIAAALCWRAWRALFKLRRSRARRCPSTPPPAIPRLTAAGCWHAIWRSTSRTTASCLSSLRSEGGCRVTWTRTIAGTVPSARASGAAGRGSQWRPEKRRIRCAQTTPFSTTGHLHATTRAGWCIGQAMQTMETLTITTRRPAVRARRGAAQHAGSSKGWRSASAPTGTHTRCHARAIRHAASPTAKPMTADHLLVYAKHAPLDIQAASAAGAPIQAARATRANATAAHVYRATESAAAAATRAE